jgi:hypothetical protein
MIKIAAGRQVTVKNAVPGASGFNAMVRALLEGRKKALKREAANRLGQTNGAVNSQNAAATSDSGSGKPEEVSSIS